MELVKCCPDFQGVSCRYTKSFEFSSYSDVITPVNYLTYYYYIFITNLHHLKIKKKNSLQRIDHKCFKLTCFYSSYFSDVLVRNNS